MSSINTIGTITEAAAKLDNNPTACFFVYITEIQNYLYRIGIIDEHTTLQQQVAYNHFPSVFGGLNLSNYLNHFIRGHDDFLTYWVSVFQFIHKRYPEIYVKLETYINVTVKPTAPPYEWLFEDIFGLNIDSLPSVEQNWNFIFR